MNNQFDFGWYWWRKLNPAPLEDVVGDRISTKLKTITNNAMLRQTKICPRLNKSMQSYVVSCWNIYSHYQWDSTMFNTDILFPFGLLDLWDLLNYWNDCIYFTFIIAVRSDGLNEEIWAQMLLCNEISKWRLCAHTWKPQLLLAGCPPVPVSSPSSVCLCLGFLSFSLRLQIFSNTTEECRKSRVVISNEWDLFFFQLIL